jgi:hypothetical protein
MPPKRLSVKPIFLQFYDGGDFTMAVLVISCFLFKEYDPFIGLL